MGEFNAAGPKPVQSFKVESPEQAKKRADAELQQAIEKKVSEAIGTTLGQIAKDPGTLSPELLKGVIDNAVKAGDPSKEGAASLGKSDQQKLRKILEKELDNFQAKTGQKLEVTANTIFPATATDTDNKGGEGGDGGFGNNEGAQVSRRYTDNADSLLKKGQLLNKQATGNPVETEFNHKVSTFIPSGNIPKVQPLSVGDLHDLPPI